MKFSTKEQQAEYQRVVALGGAKGFFGGLAIGIPVSYYLNKRWPYYQSLPVNLKAFGVIIVAVPAFAIAAERAGLAYDRSQWSAEATVELNAAEKREEALERSMTTGQKVARFAVNHEFSLIGVTWATSMLGAYAWVSRQPDQTMLQKLTQTRVWAQGMTLGVIIAAGVLTHSRLVKESDHADHSWRDIVDAEEAREHLQNQNQRG